MNDPEDQSRTGNNSNPASEKSWLDKITNAFSSEPQTREDITQILQSAMDNQIIDHEALEIIEGALKVSDQQVREIMIPRSQMVVLEADHSLEDILKVVVETQHSRYPVIGESTDDIRGILLAKELLPLLLGGRDSFDIDKIIRPASIVPESKRLNVLLREFREQRYHMAIVIDEYGGTAGLVTIEDILEEIVGEIEDETDEEESALIRPQLDGNYLINALTPVEDFNEHFESGINEDVADTIGGVVIQTLGHLPAEGEQVELEGFRFRVTEADNRQVKMLNVAPINTTPTNVVPIK